MTIHAIDPVLTAVADRINETQHGLEPVLTAVVDAETPEFGMVVVSPVSTPNPELVTLVTQDYASMLAQVVVHGVSRRYCRIAGDLIRQALCGRTRGQRSTLEAAGYFFEYPEAVGDGHPDLDRGKHVWVETYRITWQFRVTSPPAS